MKSDRITLELDTATVEQMVKRMPTEAKIELVRKLEREVWGKRMDRLFKRIDQRRRKFPISQKEIAQEIAAVRKQIYGQGNN